ncbi:MAG TPA: hypothetical protein VGP93_10600, partial [Polyangiaceae bacterium]|nr:hypothetical protein [Polyangiaceae bacterium]
MAPGFGHALAAQTVASNFMMLQISASLWEGGMNWWVIHGEPTLGTFELEHRGLEERFSYNEQNLAAVKKTRQPVVAEHSGFHDLFVPIIARNKVVAVLVSGPFATARPTSAAVLAHWRALSGRQGHPGDSQFADYLAATLSTLVLEGDRLQSFVKLGSCLGQLLAGEGKADELANEAEALRLELEPVRLVERTWGAVRGMLDDRSSRTWSSSYTAHTLAGLGLSRIADHVLVGLTLSQRPDFDPVDEIIRRDAFQRRAVALAREVGDVIAGQVGDHGVVFLSAASGATARKRQKLLDLVDQSTRLARREFGLAL